MWAGLRVQEVGHLTSRIATMVATNDAIEEGGHTRVNGQRRDDTTSTEGPRHALDAHARPAKAQLAE